MSKSDNTRPWWVRLADQPMATAEPLHDHRFSPCTLSPQITAASTNPQATRGCCWVITAAFAAVRTDNGAGEWNRQRRADRRRDRHQARLRLRLRLRGDGSES